MTWAVSSAVVVAVDLLLVQGRHGRRPGLRLRNVGERWPPPGRTSRAMFAGVAPWIVLVLVVAAWEALGIDTGRHAAHLTVSALTQAFRPLDAAMLLVWMAVGIGYGVTRARTPLAAALPPMAKPDRRGMWWAAAVFPARWGGPSVLAPLALLLPDDRAAGVAFWLAVVAAAFGIDFVARRSDGRVADAEQVLRLATAPTAVNVVLVMAWAYAGYHLFAH